jgi:hypothetical protein
MPTHDYEVPTGIPLPVDNLYKSANFFISVLIIYQSFQVTLSEKRAKRIMKQEGIWKNSSFVFSFSRIGLSPFGILVWYGSSRQ